MSNEMHWAKHMLTAEGSDNGKTEERIRGHTCSCDINEGHHNAVLLNTRRIYEADMKTKLILTAIEDITG